MEKGTDARRKRDAQQDASTTTNVARVLATCQPGWQLSGKLVLCHMGRRGRYYANAMARTSMILFSTITMAENHMVESAPVSSQYMLHGKGGHTMLVSLCHFSLGERLRTVAAIGYILLGSRERETKVLRREWPNF
eukprot:scaffold145731_cov74-Attheya_sp.AAC.1